MKRFPLKCRECSRLKYHNYINNNDSTYRCSVNNQMVNQSELPNGSMDCPLGKCAKSKFEKIVEKIYDVLGISDLLYQINKKLKNN